MNTAAQQHRTDVVPGPSGLRAVCSCGWGSVPRYTADRAYQDASAHEVDPEAKPSC